MTKQSVSHPLFLSRSSLSSSPSLHPLTPPSVSGDGRDPCCHHTQGPHPVSTPGPNPTLSPGSAPGGGPGPAPGGGGSGSAPAASLPSQRAAGGAGVGGCHALKAPPPTTQQPKPSVEESVGCVKLLLFFCGGGGGAMGGSISKSSKMTRLSRPGWHHSENSSQNGDQGWHEMTAFP